MNFKFKLYTNKLKKKLQNTWYALMKPLATVIIKVEDYIHTRKQEKIDKIVNNMTDEDVVERLLDVMIREFARYPDSEWDIFISDHDTYDGVDTIKYYMQDQSYDKYLKAWSYRLTFSSFDTNKALTYKFKDRVEKHGAFDIKFVEHQVYGQKYENTMLITLNEEYRKLFSK